MNTKTLFGLFIFILLISSCITDYRVALSNDKKILFVDGSIIADTIVTFHITQSFPLSVDTVSDNDFVNDAILNIIGSNGYKSAPAINQGKGTYQVSVGKLDDDVEYGIQIAYAGDTYQSALSKPLYTPEIDSVSWVQPEPLGQVSFYISTHDDTDRAKFFLWNYTEDWEITMKDLVLTTLFYIPEKNMLYTDYSMPYYYCWKKHADYKIASTESLSEDNVINQLLYQLEPGGDRFAELYCVTVTQKAISQGAYEYYQDRKKLNEEMGGLFTPQPSELAGNIKCVTNPSKKAMGYVETLKNISQKRIFMSLPSSYPKLIWPYWPTQQQEDSCKDIHYFNNDLLELGWSYRDLYLQGYRPVGVGTSLVPDEWKLSTCTDCRANGGTKTKPDFWPNDDK